MKKQTIKIAHLYYDLMNLYGESANIKALKKFIERQNVDAEIHFLTLGDKIDFKAYDFYYIGAGSEENEKIVIKDLMKYKEKINEAINSGKMFLVTGNAMEMFGKKIRMRDGSIIPCLNIFDYQANEEEKRIVSEIVYNYPELEKEKGNIILGFKNTSTNIVHNNERLFEFSNTVNRNNFYGMNFIGPILIRNPYFTNLLVRRLFQLKKYEYKEITNTIEFKTYHQYIDIFITNNKID